VGFGSLLVVLSPFANGLWASPVSPQTLSGIVGPNLIFLWIPWLATLLACGVSLVRKGVRRELRTSTALALLFCAAYTSLPLVSTSPALVGSALGSDRISRGVGPCWCFDGVCIDAARVQFRVNGHRSAPGRGIFRSLWLSCRNRSGACLLWRAHDRECPVLESSSRTHGTMVYGR
jgi:hypothetical protein